jgi:DNA-binding MurR/RpiR family transcriptional regulator
MAKKPNDLSTIPKNPESSLSELDHILSVVVERIKSRIAEFTPRQRALAEYIIQHSERVGFLTINELAKKAGVSEATIVRFCHIIGYKGYAHLGREIQENIQSQLGTEGRFTLTHRQSGLVSSDSTSGFERVVAHEMDNMARLSKRIKKTEFYRVVKWMAEADCIIISGCMGSGSLAKYFGYMLAKILPRVEVLDAPGTIPFNVLSDLNSNSLVFLIAFPRYPRITVEIGHWVAGKGVKIVAITDSHLSPVVSVADVSFLISVGITSFVDSYAAPMTFIDALVTELSESNPVETQQRLREYDKYASEMHMFVKFTDRGKSLE